MGYLQARLPSTFSVFDAVLRTLPPSFQPHSFLDLGCGPATASLSAVQMFSTLNTVTLYDQDAAMLRIAETLMTPYNVFVQSCHSHFNHLDNAHSVDIVALSYVLGELDQKTCETLLHQAWKHTKHFLIITLPGTPTDFKTLLYARNILHKAGAWSYGPCPHTLTCPLSQENDWCHFKIHVKRTLEHKLLKKGTLDYEEEPYCYFIASKDPVTHTQARIVRPPLKRQGHIRLDVCTPEGTLGSFVHGKKEGATYKDLKKMHWGDLYKTSS